jgi:hypothetical protein
VSLTSRYSSCYYRCATNFLELRQRDVPRILLPRTPVNKTRRRAEVLPMGFEAVPSG